MSSFIKNQRARLRSVTFDDSELDKLVELFDALRIFSLERLELVLAKDVPLNVVFRSATPLNYACRHKAGIGVVRRLLEAGASVSFHDSRYQSYPLHKAVGTGSVELTQMLINAGATPAVSDRLGQTPLHFATNINAVEVASLLIDAGADVNAGGNSGTTPLHVASKLGHVELVRLFLRHGALVDAVDIRRKATPLRNAVDHWCTEIVEILLNQGADPNVEDAYGQTPLLEAALEGHISIFKLLTAAGAKVKNRHKVSLETPLIRAAAGGHAHVVEFLLNEHQADVNAQDAEGLTPLIKAIEMNHKSVVDLLLKVDGIDVNASTSNGWTALHYAINYTNLHCNEWGIQDLLEAGADANAPLTNGQTPLHLAAQLNKVHAGKVTQLLLQHGASPEVADNEGRTSFAVAIKSLNLQAAQIMLEVGCSPRLSDLRILENDEVWESFTGGDNEMLHALKLRALTPPSLLQIARRRIRLAVQEGRGSREIQRQIRTVDERVLPKRLKEYLLFT